MVEQLTRNEQVGCSIHLVSSIAEERDYPSLLLSRLSNCMEHATCGKQVAYFTRLQSQCKIGQRREQRDRRSERSEALPFFSKARSGFAWKTDSAAPAGCVGGCSNFAQNSTDKIWQIVVLLSHREEHAIMPKIIPIRDLKNTTAISNMCHESNEPIYVTKNG